MEQLHAHEVLHMMEGNSYSEASLKEAIVKTFGEDQRFYTCSAENMDADEFTEQVFQPDLHVRDVKTFLLQGRQRVYEIHALRYTEILYAKGTRLYSVLYDRG